MASDTPELVPFSPFWTQQNGLDAKIVDRNLAAIKSAIDRANATIIRNRIDIDTLISTTTINISLPQPPSSPPSFESTEDGAGAGADYRPTGTNTSLARVWLSTPDPSAPYGVNMGALGAGVIQQSVAAGVSTPSAFALGTGLIPFGNGASLLATTGDLFWSAAAGLVVSNAASVKGVTVSGNVNSGVDMWLSNSNNGNGAFTSVVYLGDAGTRADVYFTSTGYAFPDSLPSSLTFGCTASVIFSPAYNRVLRLTSPDAYMESGDLNFSRAGVQTIEKQGSGDLYVGTLGAQLLGFYTTNITRMTIASGGNVAVANLTAGGVVYATAATGVLKIGTSAEVASAITWPAVDRVLYSSGSTTAPLGTDGVRIDAANDALFIAVGGAQVWRNLGVVGAGTYEQVRAFWSSNIWVLATESAGGTERDMIIGNASTATVAVASGTGAYLVGGPIGSSPIVAASSLSITLAATGVTRASAAGATLNAISVLGSTVSVTGSTNITTAAGFNYINVAAPTFSGSGGAKTISTAVTCAIAGPPAAAGDVTITLPMTFWVQAGRSRFDGHATLAGSGSDLGFFGFNGTAQQTSGANLTNNVTSGGTNDQIDNWTNLVTYATDAAAIRNAVYQLARKLKQINDGLRAYNMFT